MAKCRCRTKMSLWDKIFAYILLVGGFNWAFTAFGFNLVEWLATKLQWMAFATIIYLIVGFSAGWLVVRAFMGFK